MKTLFYLLFALMAFGCGGPAPTKATPPAVLPQYPDDNDPSCPQGKTVGFNGPVSEILSDNCASCHPAYTNYAAVSNPNVGNQIVSRISLPSNDVRRMPKFPADELEFSAKKLLIDWVNDGFKLESACKNAGSIDSQAFMDLNTIERYITRDLDSIDSDDGQRNARYAVMSNRSNAKVQKDEFLSYVKGLNKILNSLSTNENMIKVTPIDPSQTIYRLELSVYGLNANDWNLILSKDPYKFESRTRRGIEIQQKTGSQFPWLHADNMSFISMGDPVVYNSLTRIPASLLQEQAILKADVAQQFRLFTARLIGFNGSPISENKNRLLLRVSSDNDSSSFWQTFDPNSNFSAGKNLFQFPLVQVGEKKFTFDASETIGFLDNGLMKFGLWNTAGVPQTEAPGNVVNNNRSPFSAIIKNGLDCMRCHSSGLLQAVDQVSASVNSSGNLSANDLALVNAYYKSATTNSALFINDNKRYADALRKLSIDPSAEDPANVFLDKYRSDWSIQDAAGFVFMTPAEFCQNLLSSGEGKAQLGQLCTTPPGTVTLTQWQSTFPIIRRDFRLGLDSLGN